MARIELDQIGLTFHLRHGRTSLKEFIIGKFKPQPSRSPTKVRALRDINLHIAEGERLGILGHNGAGKSTLLKLLAGVYPPTRGSRLVEGRISSLFEISLGFEQEATGRENIRYRAYLQGETPRSIRRKEDAICEFTELGNFLHMPVRYYSAGMMVRLAFAIATAIEPEILLVDEVLSVGDLAFQQKARQRMQDMMAKARLIVLVSHDLESLARFSTRAIWMDHGRILKEGPTPEVIAAYKDRVNVAPPAPGAAA